MKGYKQKCHNYGSVTLLEIDSKTDDSEQVCEKGRTGFQKRSLKWTPTLLSMAYTHLFILIVDLGVASTQSTEPSSGTDELVLLLALSLISVPAAVRISLLNDSWLLVSNNGKTVKWYFHWAERK